MRPNGLPVPIIRLSGSCFLREQRGERLTAHRPSNSGVRGRGRPSRGTDFPYAALYAHGGAAMAARSSTGLRPASLPLITRLRLQAGRFGALAALSAGLAALPLALSRVVSAQAADAPAPDVETSRQPQLGRLNANALVYSGPGSHYYPTMKLPKDAEVIVVGVKKDWLKIQPPTDSFSYVPKAFVNVHGDGKQGKVTSKIIVRAGSSMVQAKGAVQTQLEPNQDVAIVGEADEYYKIKPPEGAFLFINREFVTPAGVAPKPQSQQPQGPLADPRPTGPKAQPTGEETHPPTTGPSGSEVAGGPASPPATQPGADYIAELQRLEADFAEMSKKPLTEQPVAEMLADYQKLASTPGVPEITRKIADVRASTLKVRADAVSQLEDAERKQKQFQDRMQAQRAEKQEIEERIKQLDIQVYAAVGTLRTSSLQVGKTTLYRLTDPGSGRTVVYVWGTDPKIGELLGQFVGIKGPMQADSRLNLKVVTPTATDAIDPAKVNVSVAAEVIPPSLIGKIAVAAPLAAPAAPAPVAPAPVASPATQPGAGNAAATDTASTGNQ